MSGEADPPALYAALATLGTTERRSQVQVSYDVVRLLSQQLYASPLKAIEELVINSWDADATECYVAVPLRDGAEDVASPFVAVADNGIGLTLDELTNLWHVGRSAKRDASVRARRRQIGKFGIGKLATYVLARRITYVTRGPDGLLGATLDFAAFEAATRADGTAEEVLVDILRLSDDSLREHPGIKGALASLGLSEDAIRPDGWATWTLVVLEELTDKAAEMRRGRLEWVLRTAMPLSADFALFLNTEPIESVREDYPWIVDFQVTELETDRIAALNEQTGENWKIEGDAVVGDSFPTGIRGRVRVSDRSLFAIGAKSEDLGRSHGFFIRVLNRLINEADPLFGAKSLSFQTFYNFAAEIEADDLDADLKAPRDDVEQTEARRHFVELLRQLFNQARERYEAYLRERDEEEKRKKEGTRDYVAPRLIERPVADVLLGSQHSGATDWQYLEQAEGSDSVGQLIDDLYADPPVRRPYRFRTTSLGRAQPLVRFNPAESVFVLNEDHELVIEFWDNPASRRLLQHIAAAEALLEVYLADSDIPRHTADQLLARRDELLRSLARSEQYSLRAIAGSLRSASDDEHDLEIAVVAAVRALGFVARQISLAGQADGSAKYAAFADGPSFTLEAKSSASVPSLPTLDFAGLWSHLEKEGGGGCLLVAPAYAGLSKGDLSEVARRADHEKVSCWTIEQLARAVELSEARHVTADQIEGIVLSKFAPDEVASAVEALLSTPEFIQEELYRRILDSLEELEGRMRDTPRTVDMVATQVTSDGQFHELDVADVEKALVELSNASRGMLYLSDEDDLFVRGSLAELRRRVADLTKEDTEPRRGGPFRTQGEKASES
jgi:hypothetical protein